MYDCDKGYVLEIGPPGATCVGGKWRPLELPQCLLGQHPRLRWNRRRRSIEMRYLRSLEIMKNQRNLRRKLNELLEMYEQDKKEQQRIGKLIPKTNEFFTKIES